MGRHLEDFSSVYQGSRLLLTVKTFRRWKDIRPGSSELWRRATGLPVLLISRGSSKCRLRRRRENSGSLILNQVKLKSPKVSLVSPRDPKKPSLRTSTLVSS